MLAYVVKNTIKYVLQSSIAKHQTFLKCGCMYLCTITSVCHEATSVVITFIVADGSHRCTNSTPVVHLFALVVHFCVLMMHLWAPVAHLCVLVAHLCALGMHAVGHRACTRRMLCTSLSTDWGEQCRRFTLRRPHDNKALGSHEIKRLDGWLCCPGVLSSVVVFAGIRTDIPSSVNAADRAVVWSERWACNISTNTSRLGRKVGL